jgi:ribonuclease HI
VEEAEKESEEIRPGILMFTDGSLLENGTAGYSVVWRSGQSWTAIKTHMAYKQEAYDTECAAFARALESTSRRQTTPERATIVTDFQATIARIASEGPGPGQQYTLQSRKHIAALRRARPSISTKGSPAMRRPTSWRKLRQKSQTPAGEMAELA